MLPEKTYILCILELLKNHSDPEHILSISEIQRKLELIYDVRVDRRTVYRNIDHLIQFGYDISTYEENRLGYYLRERDFEPSELRLLCDAVYSAEFIPEKSAKQLLEKLRRLGSEYRTKQLSHLIYVKADRRAPNKELFLNIEILEEAISQGVQVDFDYISYDINLTQKPRREKRYLINPYAMCWKNEQYYLICNYDPYEGIAHYRLDRIKNIKTLKTPVKPPPEGFDAYRYIQNTIHMFGGEVETYTIKCSRSVLNDVVDRFGEDIHIIHHDEDTFTAIVKAAREGMKLWCIHYLAHCQVLEPKWLRDYVVEALSAGMEKYQRNST